VPGAAAAAAPCTTRSARSVAASAAYLFFNRACLGLTSASTFVGGTLPRCRVCFVRAQKTYKEFWTGPRSATPQQPTVVVAAANCCGMLLTAADCCGLLRKKELGFAADCRVSPRFTAAAARRAALCRVCCRPAGGNEAGQH